MTKLVQLQQGYYNFFLIEICAPMTGLQRRTMELSDAISSLIKDQADEIYWQKLGLYESTTLLEIPFHKKDEQFLQFKLCIPLGPSQA